MARFTIASVLVALLTATAYGTNTEALLACKRLQVQTDRRDPTLVRLRWKCPTRPAPLPLPSATADPTQVNAVLLLQHPSGTPALGGYIMPGSAWRRIGPPGAAKAFRFKGSVNASPNSCHAVISRSGLSVSCRVFVGQPLPAGYPLAISLRTLGSSGDKQLYCAEFGGEELANDPQRLIRVNAPAPAACAPF